MSGSADVHNTVTVSTPLHFADLAQSPEFADWEVVVNDTHVFPVRTHSGAFRGSLFVNERLLIRFLRVIEGTIELPHVCSVMSVCV